MEGRKIPVCRLCMEIVGGDNFELLKNVINELRCIPLNLNYNLTSDPVICNKCKETLLKSLNFKKKCLKIRHYIQKFETHESCQLEEIFIKISKNKPANREDSIGSICRFCLRIIHVNEACTQLISLECMLRKCLPEMNLTLVRDSFICDSCKECVQNYFNFITHCLAIENRVNDYFAMKVTDSKDVSLFDMLASSVKMEVDNDSDMPNNLSHVNELPYDFTEVSSSIKQEEICIKNEDDENPQRGDRVVDSAPNSTNCVTNFIPSENEDTSSCEVLASCLETEKVPERNERQVAVLMETEEVNKLGPNNNVIESLEKQKTDVIINALSDNLEDNTCDKGSRESTFPSVDSAKATIDVRTYIDSGVDSISDTELTDSIPDDSPKKEVSPKVPGSLEPPCEIQPEKIISQNSAFQIADVASPKRMKKIMCKFCRSTVSNFHRHLTRHHSEEREVRDFLRFPTSTEQGRRMRRNALAFLRYEVNFENFVKNKEYIADRLPCIHCKRIVGAKYLGRHFKKCIVKPSKTTDGKVRHQAVSQTLLASATERAGITSTSRMNEEVLSRMAPDEIGFVARKDPLIRHFGEFFLKNNKRQNVSHVCSNKMRECSRLLIELRRQIGKPELTCFEMLDPDLFDDVVSSVKVISGYGEGEKTFSAPSLALHLSNTLQQICALSTNLLLNKTPDIKCDNPEDKVKGIKQFRCLVRSRWSNEVAPLALKNLAENKSSKPSLLLLTKDVIKLRNHIIETADDSVALLKENGDDREAFMKLVDASLAFTILFNRNKIKDAQRVETSPYLKSSIDNDRTEFWEQPTKEFEKTLIASCKSVVANEKGNRAYIIFFPQKVQEYIRVFLAIRNRTEVVQRENQYLFAYSAVTNQPVMGNTVLKNFVKSSKMDRPDVVTSNYLRKHIVTLMRIISLDKTDFPQFAKFLRHPENTYQDFCETTQDPRKTVRLVKMLNSSHAGQIADQTTPISCRLSRHRSKRSDIGPSDVIETAKVVPSNKQLFDSENNEDQSEPVAKRKRGNRVRWTPQQRELVTAHFRTHIEEKIAPKKAECEDLIKKHGDVLNNLDWVRVKTFVYNVYTGGYKNE